MVVACRPLVTSRPYTLCPVSQEKRVDTQQCSTRSLNSCIDSMQGRTSKQWKVLSQRTTAKTDRHESLLKLFEMTLFELRGYNCFSFEQQVSALLCVATTKRGTFGANLKTRKDRIFVNLLRCRNTPFCAMREGRPV